MPEINCGKGLRWSRIDKKCVPILYGTINDDSKSTNPDYLPYKPIEATTDDAGNVIPTPNIFGDTQGIIGSDGVFIPQQYAISNAANQGYSFDGTKYVKTVAEEDPNRLWFSEPFQALNTGLDLTRLVANTVNSAQDSVRERRKLLQARKKQSLYNIDEDGLNNIPVYAKTGGNMRKFKFKEGGDPTDPPVPPRVEDYESHEAWVDAFDAYVNDLAAIQKEMAAAKSDNTEAVSTSNVNKNAYNGYSVVDYLKSANMNSSKAARKGLAETLKIKNYDFSAAKNLELLQALRDNNIGTSQSDVGRLKAQMLPPTKKKSANSTGSKKQNTTNPTTTVNPNTPVDTDSTVVVPMTQDEAMKIVRGAIVGNKINPQIRPNVTTISQSNPYNYSESDSQYDDSRILRQIENDPSTPRNRRIRNAKVDGAILAGSALAGLGAGAVAGAGSAGALDIGVIYPIVKRLGPSVLKLLKGTPKLLKDSQKLIGYQTGGEIPYLTEDVYANGGDVGEGQEELAQLLQVYSQMSGVPVEDVVAQLSQIPDDKKQDAIMEIIEFVKKKDNTVGDEIPTVGSNPDGEFELEKGEVFEDTSGDILKVAETEPVHEDGGSDQSDVSRVLEDTSTKRKDKDSKALRITPEEAKKIVGFKPKNTTSHSSLYEEAVAHINKEKEKLEKKINTNLDYIKYSNGGKYAQASMDENLRLLAKFPTNEDMFDAIYEHQESVKNSNGIKTGAMNRKFRIGGPGDEITDDIKKSAKKVTSAPEGAVKIGETSEGTYYKLHSGGVQFVPSPKQGTFAKQDPKTWIPTLIKHSYEDLVNNKIIKDTPENKKIYDDALAKRNTGTNEYFYTENPIVGKDSETTTTETPTENTMGRKYDVPGSKTRTGGSSSTPINLSAGLGNLLGFIDASGRIPVDLEQLDYSQLRAHELNPLPTLMENAAVANATASKLPMTGAGMANQVAVNASRYDANNKVLSQYEQANKAKQDAIDAANAQSKYQVDAANLGLRDQFETRVLTGKEKQRQQKFEFLNSMLKAVDEANAFDANKNLLLKLSPYFNEKGEFNGKDYTMLLNTVANSGGSIREYTDPSGKKMIAIEDQTGKVVKTVAAPKK